jgi:hypothetical protein
MKSLILMVSLTFCSLSAHAELNSYCIDALNQRTSEYDEVQTKLSSGKLAVDAFEDMVRGLVLAADQSSNDCAQDYDSNDREKIKSDFMSKFHAMTDLKKDAARVPAQAKR